MVMEILQDMCVFILGMDTNWVQLGDDIDGEAANDWSGTSVSLSPDGTAVAIGAIANGGDYTGHVRVYSYYNINGISEVLILMERLLMTNQEILFL